MLRAVYRMTRTKQIDQAPGQEHLHLPVSHRVLRQVRFVLVLIEDVDLVAALNGLSYIGQAQDILWRDPVPVVRIGEGQGKDAEVDQMAGAAQEEVVIGVFEIGLEEVVIDILRRQLGLHARQLHGFEL